MNGKENDSFVDNNYSWGPFTIIRNIDIMDSGYYKSDLSQINASIKLSWQKVCNSKWGWLNGVELTQRKDKEKNAEAYHAWLIYSL